MGPDEITLPEHERHSEARAHHLEGVITHHKEHKMGEGMTDKVDVHNHFKPGKSGGGDGLGGLGAMAAIAALGNRNEPSNSLGAALPALMMAGRPHDGFGIGGGLGAGLLGGILGGLLFSGRRGGFLGGGGECEGGGGAETRIDSTIVGTAVLSKLGNIEAAIPLASAQTENVILQQTNTITQIAAAAQLANQQGFAQTGDRIQNTATALAVAISNVNQNVLEQACQTRAAIAASTNEIVSKIDSNTITALQTELLESRRREDAASRTVDLNALRSNIEINNTATATQTQQQAQFQVQAQFQDLHCKFGRLFDLVNIVHQEARATNSNVIAGNTGPVTTGAQTSTPTNVNA